MLHAAVMTWNINGLQTSRVRGLRAASPKGSVETFRFGDVDVLMVYEHKILAPFVNLMSADPGLRGSLLVATYHGVVEYVVPPIVLVDSSSPLPLRRIGKEVKRPPPDGSAFRPSPATGVDDDLPDSTLFKVDVASSWYHDILIFLSTGNFPIDLTPLEKRRLLLKRKPFTLIGEQLYKAGLDGILRRCVAPHEVQDILADAHEGHIGGHQSGPTTAEKILQSGLWWPYLFRDAIAFVKLCDTCQRCAPKPSRLANRPLQVSMAWLPYERWGIDFVGPITPTAQPSGARYLLVATDYATKWAEVAPTKGCTAATVAKFLYQNIFCRFGCPLEITSDQHTHFVNDLLATMFHKYQIFHRKSCSYYPRANGQAESINKVLLMLLRKTCYLHPTTWADAVLGTTWAYRTSFKATIKHTPFQLAFGVEAIAPFEFISGSVRVGSLRVQNVGGDVANTSSSCKGVPTSSALKDNNSDNVQTRTSATRNCNETKPKKPLCSKLDDKELDLLYDPILDCYYDPKTNRYYELK
ncbi:hypothetical protein L7F22_037053 [Adiantum nelumboides]|nr:hypothetical protein [Adiantum nelumboides]